MRAWVDAAEKQGVASVFSACYESGVGTALIGQLAAAWGGEGPCGIDTYSQLAEDILVDGLEWEMGGLDIRKPFHVDEERLLGSRHG